MEFTIDQTFKKGVEAHKAGKFQEADQYYSAVIKAEPNHPDANHNMGVLTVGVGKTEAALPFFKTAVEVSPSIAQFWLSYIDALIKLNRVSEANATLDKAKKTGAKGDGFDQIESRLANGANIEAEQTDEGVLGKVVDLRESGKYDEAIDLLLHQIKQSPADPKIPSLLSHCFILIDNLEEAQIYLDAAKSINPGIASVGWNEARLLLKQKKVTNALAIAVNTNKLFPDDVEGMGVLGSCLRANGNFDESLKYLNRAIELSPTYAEAFINRGLISFAQKNKENALGDLEKAYNLKPHVKQIWHLILNLKIDAKEFKSTISLAEEMLKTDSSDEKIIATKALCHQHLKDYDQAVICYNKSLDINPHYPEAWANLGLVLKDQGKIEKAIGAYQKALLIKPDSAETYNNMGTAFKEQGDFSKAIEAYQKALSVEPNYVEAYNNIGNVFKNQGKLDQAAEAYNKALSIKSDHAESATNLAQLFFESSRFEEASELFSIVDSIQNQTFLLKCLYELDKKSKFYNQLDYLIERGQNNCVIGSYISRSNIRYGSNRDNPFCNDPLKYVIKTDLAKKCDFKKIFVDNVASVLSNEHVHLKSQGLLKNGLQTAGNIFTQVGSVTNRWQDIIRSELKDYKERFHGSEDGFIKNWPSDYRIYGWLISMKNGGELSAHIHDTGWITGSIYINVPPKIKEDSGNLAVTTSDSEYGEGGAEDTKSIDVVTGSLCLFPSSLLHYTIPFESDEDRIVLAFDVEPIR